MSATATKPFPIRAVRRVKDAFADVKSARRRRLELRAELHRDHRKRAEIERLEALMRFRPRI